MMSKIPQIADVFPKFNVFVRALAASYREGEIQSWQSVALRTREFFTSNHRHNFNKVIPGWVKFSQDAEGDTLVHIVCVFIALLNAPEYAAASGEEKALMEWSGLLHDIGKQTVEGQRDPIHAFRSAAQTAIILPNLGFEIQVDDPSFIHAWMTLTQNAYFIREGVAVPDNAQLSEIIAGIDAIFGVGQPGSWIVKTVLFHMSLEAEKDWPCAAPLSGDEIQLYLDADLFRILSAQMLADSASYNLFSPATEERYRAEILESLENVRQIITAAF